MLTVFLGACANTKSSTTNQAQAGLCESTISQVKNWLRSDTRYTYEFNSDCSGQIIECNASFTYSVSSGSLLNLNVSSSNVSPKCPLIGTDSYTIDQIKVVAGIVTSMSISNQDEAIVFSPLANE